MYVVGGIGSRRLRYTASATTPTISFGTSLFGRPGTPRDRTERPIGLAPFRNLRTNAWLTIATGGAPFRSASVKLRPATSGVPNVANQRGVMAFMKVIAWRPGSGAAPEAPTLLFHP